MVNLTEKQNPEPFLIWLNKSEIDRLLYLLVVLEPDPILRREKDNRTAKGKLYNALLLILSKMQCLSDGRAVLKGNEVVDNEEAFQALVKRLIGLSKQRRQHK